MEPAKSEFRDRLLAQQTADPESLRAYRGEVEAMLARQEKLLRREKWGAGALWVYAVLLGTAFLTLGGLWQVIPAGVWLPAFAGFLLLGAAVELLKHFINRARVEILKEVKRVEMRVLELHELLRGLPPGSLPTSSTDERKETT
jgi:hypothetical protein